MGWVGSRLLKGFPGQAECYDVWTQLFMEQACGRHLAEAWGGKGESAGHCVANDPVLLCLEFSLLTFCLLFDPENFWWSSELIV